MSEDSYWRSQNTRGLPIGWIKFTDPLQYFGPGGVEFSKLHEVYSYEAKNLRETNLLSNKRLNKNSQTARSYFTHAVTGTQADDDELWMCYTEFLDLISAILNMDFTIGVDIHELRANICIPSEYRKKFAHLIKRLYKFGEKLRVRITKHREQGYYTKDVVCLFKRLIKVMFPRIDGNNMFVMRCKRKENIKIGNKRKRICVYDFVWYGIRKSIIHFNIPKECVIKSLQGLMNES